MAGIKKTGGRRAPHPDPVRLAQPGENDILCGKDRSCALHPGSQRFRVLIDSYRATYQKATTKYDKMCITKEIYEVLSQKARFLKYNDKDKLWEEITPLQGRDKIGHALRFANNQHGGTKGVTATGKPKRSRKALKRQGSFSSTSVTSGTSSAVAAPPPSKAELVKNLVEVAKEEPKVFAAVVDQLTLEGALATTQPDAAPEVQEAAVAHHQRVASLVDPAAWENIAYAVDCNADDAALDELISLLNHDDTIMEEDIQDVLDMVADAQEVPPTIAINVADGAPSSEEVDILAPLPVSNAVDMTAMNNSTSSDAAQHARQFSDAGWSVMQEPIGDVDWR